MGSSQQGEFAHAVVAELLVFLPSAIDLLGGTLTLRRLSVGLLKAVPELATHRHYVIASDVIRINIYNDSTDDGRTTSALALKIGHLHRREVCTAQI